jgi:hypothetical protein
MSMIIPQKDLTSISEFEPNEILCHLPKPKKLLPTPRTRMGNKDLPRALPLKPINFHPNNPA